MPLYSHSRLATYETCPQQYKLRYIDRLKVSLILTKLNSLAEEVNKTNVRLVKKREDEE